MPGSGRCRTTVYNRVQKAIYRPLAALIQSRRSDETAEEIEAGAIDVNGPCTADATGRTIANFRATDGNRFQIVDD